jgi:hypothetical protein
VDGAPRACDRCAAALCLRKQVVNLALGLTDQMLCLQCLATENSQTPSEVLEGIKDYVLGRECFAKQWKRYDSVEYCPDRTGCIPGPCFE